jgi:hypothetical protein
MSLESGFPFIGYGADQLKVGTLAIGFHVGNLAVDAVAVELILAAHSDIC